MLFFVCGREIKKKKSETLKTFLSVT